MRKLLMAMAAFALALALGATPASAGEWNPGRGYIFSPPNEKAGAHSKVLIHANDDSAVGPAKSICSFSGRDDPDPGDAFWNASPAKGKVQSPGQALNVFGGHGLNGSGCGPGAGE